MTISYRALVIGSLALLATPATAFDAFSLAGQQAVSYSFQTMHRNRANIAMEAAVGKGSANRQQPRGTNATGAGAGAGAMALSAPDMAGSPAAPVRLTYSTTAALQRQTKKEYGERLKKNNPALLGTFQQYVGQNDYSSLFRTLISKSGLSDNDLADVFAAFAVLGWLIAHDNRGDIPPGQYRAVRNQFAAGLASNPELASPANRARLAEELKLTMVFLMAGWQGAVREGQVKQYSDGVAAMYRQQGMDMRKFRLIDTGLVPG